jgi:hypothetical protein
VDKKPQKLTFVGASDDFGILDVAKARKHAHARAVQPARTQHCTPQVADVLIVVASPSGPQFGERAHSGGALARHTELVPRARAAETAEPVTQHIASLLKSQGVPTLVGAVQNVPKLPQKQQVCPPFSASSTNARTSRTHLAQAPAKKFFSKLIVDSFEGVNTKVFPCGACVGAAASALS